MTAHSLIGVLAGGNGNGVDMMLENGGGDEQNWDAEKGRPGDAARSGGGSGSVHFKFRREKAAEEAISRTLA